MGKAHWGTTVLPGALKSQHKQVELVWETLPPHPVVMAETTAMHRQIRALGVSDGVMLLGYGDWNENLGPVKVIGYDLSTLEPVTLMTQPSSLGNEAWDRIRIIDGKAYLPHTDPTLNNQGAYTTNENGIWETVKVGNNPSMIHTFDVIKFKGRMMACGSQAAGGTGAGVVYTETAPGSREFTRTLLGDLRDDFARFYKFFVRDEGNEVMVQNSSGGLESFVTTDGSTWSAAPGEPQNWGNNAWDSPAPLPVGWPSVATRYATLEHEGWLWITQANGVVKRARYTPPGGGDWPHNLGDAAYIPDRMGTVDGTVLDISLPADRIAVDPSDPTVAVITT